MDFKGNYLFRKFFLGITSVFIYILDNLWPKKKNLCLFAVGDYPFNSNQRALFEYLKKYEHMYRPIVFLNSKSEVPEGVSPEDCVWLNTWKGVYYLISSKTIVVHHGRSDFYYWGISSEKHLILNVWHGVPIKVIGELDTRKYTWLQKLSSFIFRWIHVNSYTYTVTSSHLDSLSMSACFRQPLEHFLMLGLPRNDWFVSNDFSTYFSKQVQTVSDLLKGKRLVLYAPTFRENGRGFYSFSFDELSSMNSLLEQHNAVLGVRMHINAQQFEIEGFDNIIVLDAKSFPETQAVLSLTDILITDYSGIWVDFLLRSKPIIGFVYDFDDYMMNQRALMYSFESVFPGPFCYQFEHLLNMLRKLLDDGNETHILAKQKLLTSLFHKYQDGKSCERIHNYLQQNL